MSEKNNQIRVINNSKDALIPKDIHEATKLAEIMSIARLVPNHLQDNIGDCLMVIMQAQRWGMDAFSVAQCTSVVRGKLCFEGKLVAAALYATGAIDGSLDYKFHGEGKDKSITITGRRRGSSVDQKVTGHLQQWRNEKNEHWNSSPEDMLIYRGTRQWARRFAPEVLLGAYTPDEIDNYEEPINATVIDVTPVTYSPEIFDKNFEAWKNIIQSGKRSASDIINMIETKAKLSDAMKEKILACEHN